MNNIYNLHTKKYLEQFFVGLLDGDGTIVVDSIRNDYRRVRIVISLKLHNKNNDMLHLLQNNIGGNVSKTKKYVTLLICSRKDISNVASILTRYPLLTSRKICQWNFALNHCINFNGKNIDNFIVLRDSKFKEQLSVIETMCLLKDIRCPTYYPVWLSGFIEAEGNFSILRYKTGGIRKQQFNIGQNHDKYLIEMIKEYFKSPHSIRKDKNSIDPHYRISIGSLKYKINILNHFKKYPLLGEKIVSYNCWISNLS